MAGPSGDLHARAGHHFADEARALAAGTQHLERRVRFGACNHRDHADAAVERPVHLRVTDAAAGLDPVPYRIALPGAAVQAHAEAFGQHARDVVGEPAARDVREPVHVERGRETKDRLHVDARRRHQEVDEARVADARRVAGSGLSEQAPDQRVTVRVGPRRGEPDHGVAGARARAVDDAVALYDADAESGEVVVAFRIHARHLRGLASNECAAGERAAFGDAGDHAFRDIDGQPAGRVVIEEEQRLRALHDDVVRAHGDEVLSYAVVQAGVDREPELGADAVGARDQHRALPAALGNLDHRAEAADAREDFGTLRACDARLDALDEFLAGIDVDAGIPVGQRRAFSHRGTSGLVR